VSLLYIKNLIKLPKNIQN